MRKAQNNHLLLPGLKRPNVVLKHRKNASKDIWNLSNIYTPHRIGSLHRERPEIIKIKTETTRLKVKRRQNISNEKPTYSLTHSNEKIKSSERKIDLHAMPFVNRKSFKELIKPKQEKHWNQLRDHEKGSYYSSKRESLIDIPNTTKEISLFRSIYIGLDDRLISRKTMRSSKKSIFKPKFNIYKTESETRNKKVNISFSEKKATSSERPKYFLNKSTRKNQLSIRAYRKILPELVSQEEKDFYHKSIIQPYLLKSKVKTDTIVFMFSSSDDYMKKAFLRHNWIESNMVFDIRWDVSENAINFGELHNGQLCNHFPNNHELTTKVGLARNLKRLAEAGIDSSAFFPRCYDLSEENGTKEFIKDFEQTAVINFIKKHADLYYEMHRQ